MKGLVEALSIYLNIQSIHKNIHYNMTKPLKVKFKKSNDLNID